MSTHIRDIWYTVYNTPSQETVTCSVLKQMGISRTYFQCLATYLVRIDRVGTGHQA